MPLGNRRRGHNAITDGSEAYGGNSYNSGPPPPRFSMSQYQRRSDKNAPRRPTEPKKRKRKVRWGDPDHKENLEGMPSAVVVRVTDKELENYALAVRLEEIGRKLRTGEFIPAENQRSPSPEPMYDSFGKRSNTREQRYREKLEDERHRLIAQAIDVNPDFRPPADYKRPSKYTEKVYVPDREFPEINFIGLLIGPRGNTLKTMERESGAKISIRGRGSVKEGKGRSDAASSSNQEEDLHCLVTADTDTKVQNAVKAINKIIETAASVPEGQNELKRNQLRELAALNGTLRDDENQVCPNCGGIGHRRYDCPEAQNFTASIVCRNCGGTGHMARDCTQQRNGGAGPRDEKFDSEYMNLMAELGENVPGGPKSSGAARMEVDAGAPWARRPDAGAPAPTGTLPPWQQAQAVHGRDGEYPQSWRLDINTFAGAAGANPWQNNGGYEQGYGGHDQQQAYGGYDYETYAAAWAQYYQQHGYPAGGVDPSQQAPPPPPSEQPPPPPPPQ